MRKPLPPPSGTATTHKTRLEERLRRLHLMMVDMRGDGNCQVWTRLVDMRGDGNCQVWTRLVDMRGDGNCQVWTRLVDMRGDGNCQVWTRLVDLCTIMQPY